MKATRIRITLGLVAVLGLGALAAVLGLGAHTASADDISPTGPTTASLCSGTKVTIKLGTATVNCTSSSAHFDAQPSASGQPVCGTISAPTLSGCTVTASGFTFSATCTTNSNNGPWKLCAFSNNTSDPSDDTASLTIPQGGVTCTASILGQTCKATASSASSGSTINGTWSNSDSSARFGNQIIPTTTSGGFPCPSGTSSTFSACYQATNDATGQWPQIAPN